jgi:hypothetical protein
MVHHTQHEHHYLGQYFMMKMNWFKFSIPSLDCLKLGMTLATLKIRSILIYDPTIPRTWQARKKTCKNCMTCFAHQIKVFSISTSHTTSHWYNCNSFFNVDMIVSSYNTIYPKNKSSSSTIVSWFVVALIGFKWKKTCNKRGHTILMS